MRKLINEMPINTKKEIKKALELMSPEGEITLIYNLVKERNRLLKTKTSTCVDIKRAIEEMEINETNRRN